MSSRMFQGVLLQLSEAAQTTIGVIDAEGNVISCSDTTLIGEKTTTSPYGRTAERNGNPIRLKNWKNPPQEGSVLRVYLGEQFAGMGQVKDGEIRFRCMLLGGNES